MRKVVVALLYSYALSSQTSGDELSAKSNCDSNSVADGSNDQCQLLQGSVGVVSHQRDAREGRQKDAGVGIGLVDYYQEDKRQHAKKIKDAKGQPAKKIKDAKGFPETLQKLFDGAGSTDAISKDFEAIKSEATQFLEKLRSAVEKLKADIKGGENIDEIAEKVRETYAHIHSAAEKLTEQLKKTETDFLGGVAQAMSEQFQKELNNVFDHITSEAQKFATAFDDAARELVTVHADAKATCATMRSWLEHIKSEAEQFAKNALNISPDGLNEALKEAIDKLPSTIREEINRILDKAKEAVNEIEGFPKATQDLAHAVAAAFGDHCSDLGGARQMEVGILSSLVVITMSFYL